MPDSLTNDKKRKSLLKNPFLWGAVAGMVILPVLRMLAMARRDAPPPIVEVSNWSLFDFKGQVFSSEDLKGKLVFFNLYVENCSASCAASFDALGKVSARFNEKESQFKVLSITAPLENDDAFNQRGQAIPNWVGLRGSLKEVEELATKHFDLDSVLRKQAFSRKSTLSFREIAEMGLIYMLDQNGDLRIAISDEPTSLAGFVRAGLFLLEKGPDD